MSPKCFAISVLTIEVAGSSVVISSTNSPVTSMRNKHLRRYARLPLDVSQEHALNHDVSVKVLADVTNVLQPKIAGDGGQVRPLFLENYQTGVRPTTETESHSTARHQFLSRISSVVRFSAGAGEDATSHEPHRSISNGLGMARSGLAGVSRFVSCKCDAHFSVHPFPPLPPPTIPKYWCESRQCTGRKRAWSLSFAECP